MKKLIAALALLLAVTALAHVDVTGKVILYFILCAPPHRDILTARMDGFLARQTGHVFERL